MADEIGLENLAEYLLCNNHEGIGPLQLALAMIPILDRYESNGRKKEIERYLKDQFDGRIDVKKTIRNIKLGAEVLSQIASAIDTTAQECSDGDDPVDQTKCNQLLAHFCSTCSNTIKDDMTSETQRTFVHQQLQEFHGFFRAEVLASFTAALDANMSNGVDRYIALN